MTNKEQQLNKLTNENKKITKDTIVEKRVKDKLKLQIEEATAMPDVSDYILQKKEQYNLETVQKNWTKKVEIMEMAAKRNRSLINKTKSSL